MRFHEKIRICFSTQTYNHTKLHKSNKKVINAFGIKMVHGHVTSSHKLKKVYLIMTLTLNSQPRWKHDNGNEPKKCLTIQAHFHKCEKIKPNIFMCMVFCHNPTLREVWGRHSHSRKWDLKVLRDSQKFRVRLQGSKHLALRCSLYRWKALKESYKFALNLIPIGGLSKKLWMPKVPGVQTRTKRPFRCGPCGVAQSIYYMGEGGGFPRIWAVVSQVGLELPVACPST